MIDGTESSSFGFSHATGHFTPIHSHIGDIFSPKDAQETPPALLATSSSQPIDLSHPEQPGGRLWSVARHEHTNESICAS